MMSHSHCNKLMNPPPLQSTLPFHLFDDKVDVCIVERRLPHWSQAGAICFITFRTQDSMPQAVLEQWFNDRARWLRARKLDPTDASQQKLLQKLGPKVARDFLDAFWNRWHDALDAGHGACLLRRPELGEIVASSLRHFDGERYLMTDFVIMPNHVHLLASFPDERSMLAQCESWKHYTATQINRQLGQKGRFWQQDGFDHLLRSEEQFQYLHRYISQNPAKARLGVGEYIHHSKLIGLDAPPS
jgi:putative transposase